MKIVIWIGNEPNQKALANKIQQLIPLSGIVTESKQSSQKITFKLIIEKVIEKCFFPSLGKAWINMGNYYSQTFTTFPDVQRIDVENINSKEVFEFTKQIQPDLILVSGTRLIKKHMFELPTSIGVLNLHTGLSPYVKGGPNCTNICLANREFHLIGNTIMWIDEGIDSGNILTTELTPLSGNESMNELHIKVMDHAHDLYLRAVHFIAQGDKQSIPQDSISNGKTYFNREWTLKRKIQASRNHSQMNSYFSSRKLADDRLLIKTVSLKTKEVS